MAHGLVHAGCALVLGVSLTGTGVAQQQAAQPAPSFSAKPLVVSPITGDDKKELVVISIAIPPGGAVPMHTHPGDCVGSVVEGTVEFLVEGQAPRRFTAGDAYNSLRGTVHGFRNVGEGQARLLNGLVADKGAPRTQMVGAPVK
jgi:quercetin dioxygenase-like cupin family protein